MERLRESPGAAHVRLLFTRAEEIGFIGAIAACKLGTIPKNARIIALENSRSFDDSPIGGGPIVRVGDRLSIFNAALTGAIAKVAENLNGKSALVWQRKLMAGGACEASVFQAYGYESTCVCLPLGNYHNMENLTRVQAGDEAAIASAKAGAETISVSDYRGMIALLEACALGLEEVEPLISRMERLYLEKAFVLNE
jgi:endoglucanase